MNEKLFVSGDEAVALAVRQAKPHMVAAYPITPQTIVVERLSDFVEDGSLECEYLYVESEHRRAARVPFRGQPPAWAPAPLVPERLRPPPARACCIWWSACPMPAVPGSPLS